MAHRIYLYNYDQKTNQTFDTHLAEWNYEIPLLLYPLLGEDVKVEGVEFTSNKEQGIVHLRYFFNLLADIYQLHYKKAYYEPVNKMFELLEALPYDSFVLNATDVFNMNEEKHKVQAKEWLEDIQHKSKLYKRAVESQDISLLDPLFTSFGYTSFLEILQTDWINYGLGYFEEHAYKKITSSVFEESGKFGLKNEKGVILAPAVYDEIFEEDYNYGISVIQKEELFGYLQRDGKELIPPIYTDARDVFDFSIEPLAEVQVNGKSGILKIHSNTWFIAPEYEAIDKVDYGFLSVQNDQKFGLYSDQYGLIIPVQAENPYQRDDFSELFFTKQKGTSKRKYYTQKGIYLGDFIEGSISNANNCYWIKPNKLDKKGSLMNETGELILADADQLILIDDFEALAVRKGKSWKIYHTLKHRFLLDDLHISNVKADRGYQNNVFMITCQEGIGVFDAENENWLIAPNSENLHIHYLENSFLSVQKTNGYQLFDFTHGLLPELYDYISNPLNYNTKEGLLFLYKDAAILRMNEDKSI